MTEFLNLYLLVFIIGIVCFFIDRKIKFTNQKLSRVFLFLGILSFILFLLECSDIVNFAGTYTQNILYSLSLSLFLLAMKLGINNRLLKFFNIFSFIINIPIIHQFIYLFSFILFGTTLYEIPNIIENERSYRIETNNSSFGMSLNENLYFIRKDFPFEEKIKIATIPRSSYLDSINFSQNQNKVIIKSFGKEVKIDTIFNIKN